MSNLLHRKLDQKLQKEIFENLQREIENNKGEINILHQDLFECREAIVQHQERIQKIEDDQIPSNIRRMCSIVLNILKFCKKPLTKNHLYNKSKQFSLDLTIGAFPEILDLVQTVLFQ